MSVEHNGMTKERYNELNHPQSTVNLTKEEFNAGWHFCDDWDGLLIHKTHREAEACFCNLEPRS